MLPERMDARATITNRAGLKIAAVITVADNARGLVFIAHGLHGTKDQAHVQAIAQAFVGKGYTVVRWDATHSTGESEGAMEDATITGYFSDFEDVVAWASEQPWYQEPFVIAGHSLGALCCLLYAQKNPKKVSAMAPLGAAISGALIRETWEEHRPHELKEWQKTGMHVRQSISRPGLIRQLKWQFMEDAQQYDVLKNVSPLRQQLLLVAGSEDDATPLKHQQLLFDAVPAISKELHSIPGAPHTFLDPAHVEELERIVSGWIDTLHEKP